MNTTTTDHIITFAQHLATYLRINAEYRAVPRTNPQRREQLKAPRSAAFQVAEQASLNLLKHLQDTTTEPGFIERQARELITLWDERNRIFNILTAAHRTQQWDENPKETLIRLDRAEKRLRDQLNAVNTILQKMS